MDGALLGGSAAAGRRPHDSERVVELVLEQIEACLTIEQLEPRDDDPSNAVTWWRVSARQSEVVTWSVDSNERTRSM